MTTPEREVLMHESEGLAPSLLQEVLDFIRFLKTKAARDRFETALLGESAPGKDWLRPEEDEAWRGL